MDNKLNLNQLNECPVPKGTLVIIGGAEKKETGKTEKGAHQIEVLAEFIKQFNKENPVIEVITTASNEDVEETFKEYQQTFQKIIPCEVKHLNHQNRESVIAEDLQQRISSADGFFFAGGDQLKLTAIYGGTTTMQQIKQRYIHEDVVIAGTSAGAMALSTPMIFAGTGDDEMIAGEVKITTGFEFLKDVCIDTHFVHRGRFVRMAQVIATNPSCLGIGIEEDTAIVVKNGLEAKVCGKGVVIIIDGKKSNGTNITEFDKEKALTIRDLNVSILASNETFNIPQLNPPHI